MVPSKHPRRKNLFAGESLASTLTNGKESVVRKPEEWTKVGNKKRQGEQTKIKARKQEIMFEGKYLGEFTSREDICIGLRK